MNIDMTNSPPDLTASPREKELQEALNRAAYALFQVKRMPFGQIKEFVIKEHEAACRVLDEVQGG